MSWKLIKPVYPYWNVPPVADRLNPTSLVSTDSSQLMGPSSLRRTGTLPPTAHSTCRDPEAKLALEETAKDAVKTALQSASSHHRVPKETGAGGTAMADGIQNGSGGTDGTLERPAAEEADLLEAGRLAGGGGADAGFVSTQHAAGTQQPPPHIATAAAEDVSLRSTSSRAPPASAPVHSRWITCCCGVNCRLTRQSWWSVSHVGAGGSLVLQHNKEPYCRNMLRRLDVLMQDAAVPSISELPAALLCTLQPPIAARQSICILHPTYLPSSVHYVVTGEVLIRLHMNACDDMWYARLQVCVGVLP